MAKKPGGKSVKIETLTHAEAARKNIPTAEYQSLNERIEESQPFPPAHFPRAAPLAEGETRERDADLDPQIVWRGARIRLSKEQARQLLDTGEVEIGDAQLVWRGKDRQDWSDLVVTAPPLYIQEKIHPKAIIDGLRGGQWSVGSGRTGHQSPATDHPDLFADFNGLDDPEARTDFYQHDQHWSNRFILGDSLAVMASLAEREALRGKVQCIYFDPPYGIKFNSNWQVSTLSRDVKDGKQQDISREPEQIKAFRDTWKEGIHSYLTYLRDRLTVAKELLAESGSIFVQIGDENVHRVRAVMDEVFGEGNFVSQITVLKTSGAGSPAIGTKVLASVADFIVWYARDVSAIKYRQIYLQRVFGEDGASQYNLIQSPDSVSVRPMTPEERDNPKIIPTDWSVLAHDNLTSQSGVESTQMSVSWLGTEFRPGKGGWKTNASGMSRLSKACRLLGIGKTLRYRRLFADFDQRPIHHVWADMRTSGFADPKVYVVQTNARVIERCILMTTDPGDLVLDPTCGSGTSAHVAEQWGRRWITIDTSRVALALARTRLMSARYPYYLLADSPEGRRKEWEVAGGQWSDHQSPTTGDLRQGFVYERAPHVTLKSIANNEQIDVIYDKWEQRLAPLREQLSVACGRKKTLEEWEIPRERPKDWPPATDPLITTYWNGRIARQKEIDASIAKAADVELLYDRPYEDKSRVRVAGPFTVESLSPHRVAPADEEELIDILEADEGARRRLHKAMPPTDFAEMTLEHLRTAGVHQSEKRDSIRFTALTPWPGEYVAAEGRFMEGDTERRAAIFIGPEFGSVSRVDLAAAAREAVEARFDALIACAFAFDAHASEVTKLGPLPILKAKMNPDLHMAGDLKNTGKGNLFVVFGEPDVEVASGLWVAASNGRLVVRHGALAQLPGLGRLEEVNRLGRSGLQSVLELARRGALRSDKPGAAGGGVDPGQSGGGSGASRDGGVSPVHRNSEGLAGGAGDASDDRGTSRLSAGGDGAGAGAAHGGNRPNALRPHEIAALESLKDADFPLTLTTDPWTQVTIFGVDIFDPNTGEIRSDDTKGIAAWFVDTNYNEESFFVRHAYFLGANDPYKSLKTALQAEIDKEAWETLYRDVSRPFARPATGKIAVKVINHFGDEVMKVFRVG